MRLRHALVLLCLWAASGSAFELTEEERAWLEGDAEERAGRVNGGQLDFLAAPPDAPVHHHVNRITIDEESLAGGWIHLEQCHRGLDAVPRAEVIFNPERIRALEVVSSENIERAWVEGATVQLQGVAPQASLCLRAQSRALHSEGDGLFVLRNGPYMRRFLDGYYPMHVSLDVRLAADDLELVQVEPQPQPGLAVERGPERVGLDAWFEGRLRTALYFMHTP